MQPIWRKGLVVAAITLFFGLAVSPAGMLSTAPAAGHAASGQDIYTPDDSMAEREMTVTVDEYRPDGTIVTREMSYTMEDIHRIDRELAGATEMEDTLLVLAANGIISAADVDDLMAAIQTRADAANPAVRDIWLPPLAVVFFSEVSTTFRWGCTVRLGMTPFLRLINRFLKTDLQRGVDVVDLCWGLRGSLTTRGPLGEHRLTLQPGAVWMLGFIGYGIHLPLLRHSFYGAAVMTATAGLGEHDFDPWFPA